jgi:putative tricarboxylic transport membrane protein
MRISIDCALLGSVSILGIYEGIRRLHAPSFTPEPLGPGAYLLVLSIVLLLAVSAEIAVHPQGRAKTRRAEGKGTTSFFCGPVAKAFLGLVLYIILLQYIGYFLSTLCFLIACIRIFGERRWLWVILSGGGLALVFYVLFQKLAGVPLP